MKSFLPNDIKDENRKIVYEILLQHPELAKVEITELTAMSFVTVSKIVNFFEEIGLLTATGESREGSGGLGRKRTVYRFNENRYVTAGVQMIGRTITALLVNLQGRITAEYSIETEVPFYGEAFTSIFEDIMSRMKDKAKDIGGQILGIGIGVDGAINVRKKTIRMRTQNDEEQDYPYESIVERLKERVDMPILLENDVNASTLAEFRKLEDAGEGAEDLVHIAVGDGIGAGIILSKELRRGWNASAGELEYMCFDTEFRKSPSSVGWLESRLGMEKLMKMYDLRIEKQREACISYVAKHLALAITNIISLLDIGEVIVSGKTISLFPERVLSGIRYYVEQYSDWVPTIRVSEFKHSTAVGVALLAMQQEMMKVITA